MKLGTILVWTMLDNHRGCANLDFAILSNGCHGNMSILAPVLSWVCDFVDFIIGVILTLKLDAMMVWGMLNNFRSSANLDHVP